MPTLYNNLPVGDGIHLNINPTGYLLITDSNRIDKVIRTRNAPPLVDWELDVYDTFEDNEVPLSNFPPSLYSDAAAASIGDPCPPGVPCGSAANKASIVRIPSESLCCDDFDEEGELITTTTEEEESTSIGGGGGGGTINPPNPEPPQPPIVEDCDPSEEVGFFGDGGCGFPSSCICPGTAIDMNWFDHGYLLGNQTHCCSPVCICQQSCTHSFRTCGQVTARVFWPFEGTGGYCCGGGGICFTNSNGSSVQYFTATGCMSPCRLGSEFRDGEGNITLGRCGCCPQCTHSPDNPGNSVCPCYEQGVVLIKACSEPPVNCFPFVDPHCMCNGFTRKWRRRYACCSHSTDPCCCHDPPCDNCDIHEQYSDTCAVYLTLNLVGSRTPRGYYDDFGRYWGGCTVRSPYSCCCFCQDPAPACCGSNPGGEDGQVVVEI